MRAPSFDVVVPSAGWPSLELCLLALAAGDGPQPDAVIVVDDRREPGGPLVPGRVHAELGGRLRIVAGPRRGPAAARNAGWRAGRAEWVAFLDDDVVVQVGWRARLAEDLAGLDAGVAGSQGRLRVPLPRDRRATDWERDVAGLEGAAWATADMAYRRTALEALGGFDERFPRAYREDADLALRALRREWRLVRGRRRTLHPVRDAGFWVSVQRQAGNADDRFMAALHGADWRERAGAPRGRLPWHAATVGAGTAALALAPWRRARGAAGAAALAWLGLTADFAWRRIAPGPRDFDELVRMAVTSAAIPPVAAWHALRGRATLGRRLAAPGPAEAPRAVLFDRDGTLVHDVPYNGDPGRVVPVAGARAALDRLRAAGIRVAVVTNQSGVGRGLITAEQVDAVHARLAELLGPFDAICVCPHVPEDDCACRKPRGGLIREAAARLGVDPRDCVVVGDIGTDVEAAAAAGARSVLVPDAVTRPEEVAAAPVVAPDLGAAVELIAGPARARGRHLEAVA